MIRQAIVAGQFYPLTKGEINSQISSFLKGERPEKQKALAAICPHAGYIYSGHTAAAVLSRVKIPRRIFLLGPNHTGAGSPISIMAKGAFQTPLQDVAIDEESADRLIEIMPSIKNDHLAHLNEHSLEVMLPLLLFFSPLISIIPIVIATADRNELSSLSRAISSIISNSANKDDYLILASSDMTHFEDEPTARKKDSLAIREIEKLSSAGLIDSVRLNNISMCGVYPVAVALEAAKDLGAKKAQLIEYSTSAQETGDHSQVVGYAGFIIR